MRRVRHIGVLVVIGVAASCGTVTPASSGDAGAGDVGGELARDQGVDEQLVDVGPELGQGDAGVDARLPVLMCDPTYNYAVTITPCSDICYGAICVYSRRTDGGAEPPVQLVCAPDGNGRRFTPTFGLCAGSGLVCVLDCLAGY